MWEGCEPVERPRQKEFPLGVAPSGVEGILRRRNHHIHRIIDVRPFIHGMKLKATEKGAVYTGHLPCRPPSRIRPQITTRYPNNEKGNQLYVEISEMPSHSPQDLQYMPA